MKKYLFLLFPMMGLFFISDLHAQVAFGNIDLQSVSHDPNNPVGICQCDTITVRYEIKPAANFSATSSFEYQFADAAANWGGGINLNLTELYVDIANDVKATSVLDTFNSGLKWARLWIPCTANVFGRALRIVNRDANGNITPGGVSDTAYYNVNRIPTVANIDSVALVSNGVRQDTFANPYTTTVPDDIGVCQGDTVVLHLQHDGTAIQWYNGMTPLGAQSADDSLRVFASGSYYAEVFDGSCSIFSDTVPVQIMNVPTQIEYDPTSPFNNGSFRVDRTAPFDSVELCNIETALLEWVAPVPDPGLIYTYQWITARTNQVTGLLDTMYVPGATTANLIIDSSIFEPGLNRFWLEVSDGFCTDTTDAPYYVIVDTMPDARVAKVPFPGFAGPTVFDEVCMTDSINLSTVPSVPDPEWKYRWQWYDPSGAGVWRSVSGQPLADLSFDTLPRITVDTSLSEPGQPYFQDPKPRLRFFRVRISTRTSTTGEETCVFFSDSIVVRWRPEDSITFDMSNMDVYAVGRDSISFCTTDSAELIAPATPNTLINNGYFYDYQWLKEEYDSLLGRFVPVEIPGEDLRTLTVSEGGRYYVDIDDGICSERLRMFSVFVDTLPSTSVVVSNYPGRPVPNDRDLCLTDSIMLSAQDTVLPGWDYQWQVNVGAGWNDALNDTLPWLSVDTAYRPAGVDTLWFRMLTTYENRFGLTICPDTTDSMSVQFYDPPNLSFFPSDSVLLCEGDSVQVIAQGNSQQYLWDGIYPGPVRWISEPGIYTVTGTGLNGCTTTREVEVALYQTTANAGGDVTVTSGERVTLTGSGGDNYRWYASQPIAWSDFLSQSVEVSYELPEGVKEDTITIFLEVTTDDGCTDTDQLNLIVTSPEDPSIALLEQAWNMFTPNDDGMNDLWDISSIVTEYNACRLTVMNRWGSVVYEEEDFDGIWEGNNQGGNPLPDGTYYYILGCEDEVILKNAVTILRNNQ